MRRGPPPGYHEVRLPNGGRAFVRERTPAREAEPVPSATRVRPLSPAIEARRLDRTRAAIMQTRLARGYRTDDVGPPIDPPRREPAKHW